jgi:hypothetical protein
MHRIRPVPALDLAATPPAHRHCRGGVEKTTRGHFSRSDWGSDWERVAKPACAALRRRRATRWCRHPCSIPACASLRHGSAFVSKTRAFKTMQFQLAGGTLRPGSFAGCGRVAQARFATASPGARNAVRPGVSLPFREECRPSGTVADTERRFRSVLEVHALSLRLGMMKPCTVMPGVAVARLVALGRVL